MKGLLEHAPSADELARLYHELAKQGAPSVGAERPWPYAPESQEHLFALACEMLRYDPRLLSIALHWLLVAWPRLNPRVLRVWMHRMRWPQALLVVAAFARAARPRDVELRYFTDYLAAGFRPVEPQRFFFDVERPGSRRAAARLGRSLDPYTRWGFIGTERPAADVFEKELVGRYDAATRARIARELTDRRGAISMREYLDAVDGSISRPQARADLIAAGLEVSGRGRGARWSRPPSG